MSRSTSRFARIKKPLKSEMNVVPYIDVMLVLLVIFMVTAPMITSKVNVDLPKVNGQDQSSNSNDATLYTVSIDKAGQLQLQVQSDDPKPMSLSEIETTLTSALAQDENINVMVAGDQSIAYGEVMKLMSDLQQAGLDQVGLVTQPLK
ncbi:protein TolR [Acinetobacter sp. A3.8]|uniref:Tol-Pal system protein TolR n=1 Tax=Acinetobacter sedimenti TaxID=2919922 RepID=A0A9X1WYH5_9GAMM|nr:protein TolR [Acinetobacter sedimenti]MCJ8146913.1 protein TolR [Acinetobacter sedimenti]